ncbi:MAG: coiled-coil domain-containing protein [Bacteroidia bacterium]
MEETVNKRNEKKKIGILPWLCLILSLGCNGVLVYLLNGARETVIQKEEIIKTVYVEKDNIKNELVQLKGEYENLHTNNASLQKQIDEKKAQIEELIKEAERHKGDSYVIAKLRKETETLRLIMQGYVHTIDSLNTLNQKLVVEKKDVLRKLDEEKNKSTELNKEKQDLQKTINTASILSCYNVSASGIDMKRGGKKQSTTTKAKRTDLIRVSYTLGENKLAKSGPKDIYIRIMTPDGKELAKNYDDNYKFRFNDSFGYYAGKTTVDYANKEIGVISTCEGSSGFVPGKYNIEITCDGVVIGQGSLTLN